MNKRFISVLLLGFSSGLPLGLITATLQAWYTVSGVSMMTIGWLTLVGQPYAYKFLWAPVLDRWSPTKVGRRRSWIVLMQIGLCLCFTAMAFLHPQKTPLLLAIIAFFAALFSATQDTAIDAHRTEVLTEKERGAGSAIYSIAYRAAMIVSSAVAFVLAAKLGWRAMYLIMAGCFFVLVFAALSAPAGNRHFTAPFNFKETFIAPLHSFLTRKDAWLILLFIVSYKLCDAMALSLNTTFLIRYMGFSLIQVGVISKSVGLAAALLGSLLGGLWLSYISLYRAIIIFGVLQMTSNLLYAWLAFVGKNAVVMGVAIFGENFCSGLSTIALMVFLMGLCDQRYTATQYALFSAVASLGRIFMGPVSAELVAHVGWVEFYALSTMAGLPAIVIAVLLNFGSLRESVSVLR